MTTRDKAMIILGQLQAIRFPLNGETQAYYDLIDNISDQYVSLLKDFYPEFDYVREGNDE